MHAFCNLDVSIFNQLYLEAIIINTVTVTKNYYTTGDK